MNIQVEKLIDQDEMKRAISFAYDRESNQQLDTAYLREHSIIRLNMFRIEMGGIPSKAAVHFVRHSAVGQYHLVGSNRGDWNPSELSIEEWDKSINRGTPVNHYMLMNAQHLIDLSRKRLCHCSESSTVEIMRHIKAGVFLVDPDLADFMVPECWYRGGICKEDQSKRACYMYRRYKDYIGYQRRAT